MRTGRPKAVLRVSLEQRERLESWMRRRTTAQALALRARIGLDGLLDEPRPGAPRKISDSAVERIVTLTLETKPKDATHWSTRSLAERAGLS